MLNIQFTSRPADKLKSQCAVATVFSDCRPLKGTAALFDWRLNGRLSRVIEKKRFEGKFGECLLVPSEGRIKSQEILLIGLGDESRFEESQVASLIHFLLETVSQKRVSDFLVSFTDFIGDRFEWRNSIRLLVSKLHNYPFIESVRLCEDEDCVKEARKRHMDFGVNIDVSFESFSS